VLHIIADFLTLARGPVFGVNYTGSGAIYW